MKLSNLTLIFFVTLSLSCNKDSDNPENLGDFTSPERISKAQSSALSGLNPGNIHIGQKVHRIESQEVLTSQGPVNTITTESLTEVVSKKELDDRFVITMHRTEVDYSEEDQPTFKFEGDVAFPKQPEAPQGPTDLSLSFKILQSDTPAAVAEDVEILDVTFHNLTNKNVKATPPELVVNSDDCRGLSPCELNAAQINYEVIFHLSNGQKNKHQIEWLISTDTPYFASILKQCASTIVPVDNLRVLVKQCQDVVDFEF